MSVFKIEGGHKLKGEINPQGAKNEALQVISAVLLSSDKITIHNIPNIIDVNNLIDILRNLGVKVNKIGNNSYTFQADSIDVKHFISHFYMNKSSSIRGSVMTLGPLLSRFGKAIIAQPGGDKIGRRRLDTHLEGFKKLGAQYKYCRESKKYTVEAKELKGTYLLLDEASVTGTANIIMAAVLAKGITKIYNAACEPYVQQLCKMLNVMGAEITGIGSNLLTIKGVKTLRGCTHIVLPDMIEVGSWIGMAAITKSDITIKNVSWQNLGLIPNTFKRMGIEFYKKNDDIYIPEQENYAIQSYIDGSITTFSDAPWPGITPDLISILIVTAIQAKGSVLIHQKMFESRLFFVDKLIDMGAKIILCDPHRATVIGSNHKSSLKATTMSSPDIRAGIALVIAALSAKGTSMIHNIKQIDRGYENIEQRLKAIGAKIERIS